MTESKKFHYTSEELVHALKEVGLKDGSLVLVHVSTGMLGLAPECKSQDDYSKLVYKALRSIVGDNGTIIVPTYTYSYCRNEIYDAENTPSTVGPFTEYVRLLPNAIRSCDPIFSVAGVGPLMPTLVKDIANTCFGEDSLNQRLVNYNAVICTIGLGLHYATFRHHIEEMAQVPFRYKKLFQGTSITKDIHNQYYTKDEEWIYSVPLLSKNGQADAQELEKILKKKGVCKESKLGRSSVSAIYAKDYFDCGMQELCKNKWLTAVGPAADPVLLEEQRVGVQKFPISLGINSEISKLAKVIFDLPRDHVSDGITKAIELLGSVFPGIVHKFQTGYQKGNLIVPEKWSQKRASIRNADNQLLFTTDKNELRICSYSLPYTGMVTKEELFNHIFPTKDEFKSSIHESLYRKRKWGLSAAPYIIENLVEPTYQVDIEVDFSFGNMYLLESVINSAANRTDRKIDQEQVCEIGTQVTIQKLTSCLEYLFCLRCENQHTSRIVFTTTAEWRKLLDDKIYKLL